MKRSYASGSGEFSSGGLSAFSVDGYFRLAGKLFIGRDGLMETVLSYAAAKRPDIVVLGESGMGKTRFAYETGRAAERVQGRKWKGFHIGNALEPVRFPRLLSDGALSDKSLLVLDDIHLVRPEDFAELLDARRNYYPRLQLLMTGLPDETVALQTRFRHEAARFRLPPLTDEDVRRLLVETGLHLRLAEVRPPDELRVPARLFELARTLDLDSPVELATVLGPDGKPLDPGSTGFQTVELAVKGISNDLIARLAEHPELMYDLDWRKFEELVAELYDRDGYDVELTRGSKDGGVDIYALHRAPHVKFVTVIDCKRNHAGNPVGVELVKQLRSTVEDHNAHMGVITTTSYFTRGAEAYQQDRQHQLGLQDFASVHDMLKRARGH